MGKNRRIKSGGSKNSNNCSVFPAAYKLVHLHTNLIFKHSIQNLQNTTKSPLFTHPLQKSQYRPKYRQTLLKSVLALNTTPQSQFTIKTTFFLYKYKIIRKIHTFTDYYFFIKFTYKSTYKFISIFSYPTSENYYLIQQPHQTFLTWNP